MKKSGAAVAAEKLLERFGIDAPEHIKLEPLAHLLGVEIVEGRTFGCVAQLTPIEGKARIRVAPNMHEGRRRFSIAHELGHLVLRHRSRACTERDLRDWSDDALSERDANVFAASLLMPERMIQKHVDVDEARMDWVDALARELRVSFTAAAIRFVETTALACAVVLVENGIVRWGVRNDDFWPYLPARGTRVDPGSWAARAKPGAHSEPMPVVAAYWLEGERVNPRRTLLEDARASRDGVVISLLSLDWDEDE